MTKPQRLFDCLNQLAEQIPLNKMLIGKENGVWRSYTVREVKDTVDRLSAGLLALGIGCGDMSVEGRDKIAILSKNRPEWVMLDLAVQQIGAILVPIYPTVHVHDLEFVLNDAQVKMIFVNDKDLYDKVQQVSPQTPSVQSIYSFESIPEVASWKDILALGRQEHFQHISTKSEKINTEDLFTIIYTSGTTGTPKGVMLSHHNVLSNVLSVLPDFPIHQGSRVISFLPLNHIFERTATYVFLFAGASVYYAESLEALGDNLREVKPEMFTTVPRLLEKVYERIVNKGSELTGVKRKLFFWALGLANQYQLSPQKGIVYRMQLAVADKLVFSKWREALGGSVKCIVTGAAACPVKLIRIFTAAGIPILEGYGLTESSPVISFNHMEPEDRMFGTVGPILEGVSVKIAEDGEILCKGPNVMMGYYKRPDLTTDTITEGWLHTGDIGTMVDNKFLKITDRKKEIFKTSGGKYVAPQPIENKMVESPFIEQIMVVGAGEKYTGALIVPAFSKVKDWCLTNEISVATHEAIIQHPKVKECFKEIVEELNKNFNPVEQIKKFELLPCEWTVNGGELTPTLKLKRKVITEKYSYAIEHIYKQG